MLLIFFNNYIINIPYSKANNYLKKTRFFLKFFKLKTNLKKNSAYKKSSN